jgi:putative endonuclease
MYNTYILESEKSKKWYIGHSNDLKRRIQEHNHGQTKSTKNKGPWKLIFKREFKNRSEALDFEFVLKKLKNKHYIRIKYQKYFLGM